MRKSTSFASTTFGSLIVLCSACSSNSGGPGGETLPNGGTTGTVTAAGGSATMGGAVSVGGTTTSNQTGGTPGAGGSAQSQGGNSAAGGAEAQGGQIVSTTGGSSNGGATTATGGKAAGGSSAGGAATGGKAAGGSNAGGAATGGKAAGGSNAGGAATGGKAAGGSSAGGAATGGATTVATGGATTVATGGATTVATGGATTTGTGGAGNTGNVGTRPCDLYATGNTPCVAAYSMVRRLLSTYTGALYQVRSGSSASNTGTGGTLKDIMQTSDGFADTAAQDTFCSGTICTVAKLYDQSGKGNHLTVAKKGRTDGGAYAAMDDFESSATKGGLNVSGHKVYPLYMAAREGYRLAAVGAGMPRGTSPQGIYMLADGTHYGTACCWDFGNVSTDPTTYGVMNTLFLGTGYWGKGAGSGPWFLADFEGGVWAGGSGASTATNANSPSMKVPYAFGVLKTTTSNYIIRMGDAGTATSLTTANNSALPKAMNNLGGIVLGVGGDNSNNSWGTFYEGAITAGAPSDDTDLAVFQNIKAAKYGQ